MHFSPRLRFFKPPPAGGVCVYISRPWSHGDPLGLEPAGGQPREHSWLPNEEAYATTEMESDQLHVPALLNGWQSCDSTLQ